MDPGAESELVALLSGVRRLPFEKERFSQRSIRPCCWSSSGTPKRWGLQNQGGGDTRAGGLFLLGQSLSPGVDLLRPVRALKFLTAHAIDFSGPGLSVPHRYPGAQRARAVVGSQKEIGAIAKLDSFLERTSKLASRRLKREIERRGTLGEFALEPDLSTKRTLTEESRSDLLRSDGPMLLRSRVALSRCRALCRAARLKGAPLGGEKES